MSNQNYFRGQDNDDNDPAASDREEKSKPTPLEKSNNESDDLFIGRGYLTNFADEIQDKIKNKKLIKLDNFSSVILEALCNALKNNNTVNTIVMAFDYHVDNFEEDSRTHLRQLLSSPRIQFHIKTVNNSDYHRILKGSTSVKNISHLKVEMKESETLDKLLYGLSEGAKIEDLRIKRSFKNFQPKLNHLSKIGSFPSLQHLKISVYGDECEPFFTGLKNNSTITTLNLSSSIITAKFAPLFSDVLAQNTSITSLSLKNSFMDNEPFSIICKGLLKNKTIHTLHISSDSLQADLSIVGGFASKKQLKELKLASYDSTIAKIFSVDNLIITGYSSEALTAQEVKDLFEENTRLKSLSISRDKLSFSKSGMLLTGSECIKQLTAHKTLKSFQHSGRWPSDVSYKAFCEMIERNDTLEELIYDESISFEDHLEPHHEDLLKSLQKNRSLTRINLGRIYGQLESFKELLMENKHISFTNNDNWQSNGVLLPKHQKMREEIVALNERNQRNAKKRYLNRKMNSIILARSRVLYLLPMEVWREIFGFVDARLEHFGLFKQAMVKIKLILCKKFTNGPVASGFDIYEDFLTYKSVVYHRVTGDYLDGHVVKIIGWGVENGDKYWLIANSWNAHWGEKGFFKMLRGVNECGIEEEAAAGVPLN